jgi:ABC-2 type transport system permease protein
MIYLHHNITALAITQLNVRQLIPIDNSFFQTFVSVQGGLAFFVALLLGPPLVSRDLRNNALPLYLCRPFSRTEYVVGKMSVLLILLSGITWVPQLLMFLFQAYLEGFAWFKSNLWIASAIIIAGLVWVVLLALLSQTLSALLKWRIVASGAMLAIVIIPLAFVGIINLIFMTRIGNLFSLATLMTNITQGLFGTFDRVYGTVVIDAFDGGPGREIVMMEPPLWSSWAMLFVFCAICLAILNWKVKAYEVVK